MKKSTASNCLRRAAVFLLALLLAVPTGYARAGDRKLQTSSVLTDGLTYYNTITENASNRIESFSLELSPYSTAYPILVQGSGAVYGAGTISKAVSCAQSLGYHVLGAVNTDFFSTASGVPIGMVIENGVYKSSPEEEAAMVIVNGQVYLVDNPQVTLTLTNQGTGNQVQPHHLNKWRSSTGGLYLLNHDFSAVSTHASGAGWSVRMKLVDTVADPVTGLTQYPTQNDPAQYDPTQYDPNQYGSDGHDPNQNDPAQYDPAQTDETQTAPGQQDPFQPPQGTDPLFPSQPTEPAYQKPLLTVNSTLTLEVVELIEGDQAIPIGEDEYILTSAEASGYISVLRSYQVGDRVTLTASCSDPVLSAAQWAGGVGDVMVRNGSLTDSGKWTYTKTGRAPRTALGVKADGTLLVYAVDGRQSGYSMGLSQVDLAQEMQAQGCQWAVNLDGGGSTAISVWVPGQEGIALKNKPSDGSQRGCATYLMLVTNDAGNGFPSRLALKEDNLTVLAGSTLTLPETAVLDSGLNVLPTQAYDLIAYSTGLGSVAGNVYNAGLQAGMDTLSLASPVLGITGTANIHIVPSLTGLTISRQGSSTALSTLTLNPGESAQLAVAGTYWGRTALRDWSAVTWTVEGDIGTIDASGLFTMAERGGSGSITAHAGGLTRTIQVTTPYTHNDVPPEHWAYEAVEYCYSKGVVNGMTTTEFGADNLVKRCDFVLMFYRAAGKPAVSMPCTFTDVAPDAYYAEALAWAQSAGLAAGAAGETFRPEEPATREDAFTILRQVMPLLGRYWPDSELTILDQFADRDQIAEYAREPIATLVAQGIVNGRNTGIEPQGNLTRAEMATLLYKVLTSTPEVTGPIDPIDPAVTPNEPTDPIDPAVTPNEPTDPAPDATQYTLTLDQTEVSLGSAKSVTLQAVLAPALEGAEIVWASSNPAAAPVTQDGVVTNIHPSEEGTDVIITASWNGRMAACLVHCEPAVFIGTVINAEKGLNVRAAAGTDQPVTGGLAEGARVVVVAITKSGWYHIHYLHKDGYAAEGYVSGDFIQLNR